MKLNTGVRATLLAVLAAAATGLAVSVPSAMAHDSQFTGHYTLSGENWQLVYNGPYDERSGCGIDPGVKHFHDVNHNYRSPANQGPFYFYHARLHYVSCYVAFPARTAATSTATTDAASALEVPTDDRAAAQQASRAELCDRFALFCGETGAGQAAADAVRTIRSQVPVRILRLRPQPTTLNPDEHVADRTASVGQGQCVVSVLNSDGMDFPEAGAFGSGLTVEVASPGVAQRLGHPC